MERQKYLIKDNKHRVGEMNGYEERLYQGDDLVYDLKGKVILITGSTSGIGKEFALVFAEQGSIVHGVGRRKERHQELQQQLGKDRYGFTAVDLLQPDSIEKILADIDERYGGVNVLVNNAGVYLVKSFHDTSDEEFDRLIDLNLKAPLRLYKALSSRYSKSEKHPFEHVIWTGSRAGLGHYPYEAAYEVTKHGIKSLVLSHAKEHDNRQRHIVIYPGFVMTELANAFDNVPEYVRQNYAGSMAIKDARTVIMPTIDVLRTTDGHQHLSFIPSDKGVHMNFLQPVDEELRDFVISKSELLTTEVVPILKE